MVWNVEGDRMLSGQFTGFTQFTPVNCAPPRGHTSRGRLTKIQATSRPENIWPEIWSGTSKKSQQKDKTALGRRKAKAQQCTKAQRYLICIHPEDKEFNETLKNVRKKLEVHMGSAMLCKLRKTSGNSSCKTLKDPEQ